MLKTRSEQASPTRVENGETGELRWHWRKLALAMGVGKRQFFRLVEELSDAGVVTVRTAIPRPVVDAMRDSLAAQEGKDAEK